MAVRGGGRWRVDQFQFAVDEELVDTQIPAAINCIVGLITGGIDLPCPEFEWDNFYGVGRDGRSRRDIYQGPQTFTASIPEIYVLFNQRLAFKMALGSLSQAPSVIPGLACANQGTFSATTCVSFADTGATFTTFKSCCGTDRFAVFSGISVGFLGAGGAVCLANVWPTLCIAQGDTARGWNGPQPDNCDVYEIRRVGAVVSCVVTNCIGTAAGNKYAVGTQILPTWTWGARFRNSTTQGASEVGSNLQINYVGGKVNRATISARSGEHLMLALDEVVFRNLKHDSAIPSTSVPKYSASTIAPTATHPTEQPMLFSQGTISLFDLCSDFARIRSFSLEINNNIETERYVSTITDQNIACDPEIITQVPFELVEGNREITLEVEAVMETREYWEHLMREGRSTGTGLVNKTGFDFRLEFRVCACATEKLVIQGPAMANPVMAEEGAAACGLDSDVEQSSTANVGAVFNSAPHVISGEGENLVLVRMNLNVPNIAMWWNDS